MRDLVIIGAGPAGMTAAVYAARKRIDTLVLTKNVGGMVVMSAGIENYMGYTLISGAELMSKFEDQVEEFGVPIDYRLVDRVSKENNVFHLTLEDGEVIQAKSVIVATGRSPRRLNVPGEKEFIGRGVTYCSICDAPLFVKMDVVVFGGGNSALGAAEQLLKIAGKVYVVSMAGWSADPILQERVLRSEKTVVYKGYDPVSIEGNSVVEKVKIRNKKTGEEIEIPARGVFVEIGSEPNSGLVKDLAKINDRQEVMVDCSNYTSVEGLFAAGDVTSAPEKQVIVAAGEGAKAALSAYNYLIRLPD